MPFVASSSPVAKPCLPRRPLLSGFCTGPTRLRLLSQSRGAEWLSLSASSRGCRSTAPCRCNACVRLSRRVVSAPTRVDDNLCQVMSVSPMRCTRVQVLLSPREQLQNLSHLSEGRAVALLLAMNPHLVPGRSHATRTRRSEEVVEFRTRKTSPVKTSPPGLSSSCQR